MNIEEPTFKRVMRGYDIEEVKQSWTEMSQIIANQNATNVELKLQINSLKEQNAEWENRVNDYIKMETDLRDAIISSQRIAKQAQETADKEAEELISIAKEEADTILNGIQEEAQKREEASNRQLEENQAKIADLENQIFELISIHNKQKQKVDKTTVLLKSIQNTLQELLVLDED
ncbi:MAG TPA: DivIVA domain-containing protein [Desulfitobacteriaceae bacterium]|nr:DivIVA domain-containing protein [Desulfitobacteriaceae bacterium]